MFYFFIKIIISLIIILFTFFLFNKKEITILEIIILLFIFNINILSLYLNINISYLIIISLIIILIYYLYIYLYNTNINKKINNQSKAFINRGIINFNELIKNNYSYESLIFNIRKKGYNNPSEIDYCIKNNNDLIIFKKDTVKNYPISIIIDGLILKDNLFSVNKTIEWLNKKINENNLCLKNINYAYYKNKEIYFITD